MVTEIKIILEDGSSNKAKGNCFEELVRNLLSIHQYKVRQNLRFTGMEIDLLAEHKQRQNETLYQFQISSMVFVVKWLKRYAAR
jgi:hypothetical protein